MKTSDTREAIRDFSRGRLSRRELGRLMGYLGVGAVASTMLRKPALADDPLAILSWSGYDIPEMAPDYYAKHPKPAFNLMGSDREGFQMVRAGYQPDLVHAQPFIVQSYRDAGLVDTIDISRLTHWNDVFPSLRQPIFADGKIWIAPFSWGNSSVVYRTDKVTPKEESWEILWDESLKGKLSQRDDVEVVALTGLLIGAQDRYAMTDAELAKVKEKLLAQRPLLRFYWSSQTDLEQSLASGEVVASYAWNASMALLKKQGIPVAMMQPKEGMLTWTDGLILLKNRRAPTDLAYEFINAYMAPGVGKFVIENYGYGSANREAFDISNKDRLVELGIQDPEKTLTNAIFIKEIRADLQDKYNKLFMDVKLGA
jgi:spermidine/putrescine transport system substrate-binding protein